MIRRAARLALLAAAVAATAGAAPRGAFEDIPFGTPRSDVRATVISRLKIQPIQAFDGIVLRGENDVRLVDQTDAIFLQGYRFNGRAVDALLFFNVNGKFFRVEYDAQPRPVSYFQTATRDDALFFSKAFQKIYGAPTFEMNPKPVEMRPGSIDYFWRWTRGHDTVYTAIAAGEEDYGAIAVVSDDSYLREEPLARPADGADSVSTETVPSTSTDDVTPPVVTTPPVTLPPAAAPSETPFVPPPGDAAPAPSPAP